MTGSDSAASSGEFAHQRQSTIRAAPMRALATSVVVWAICLFGGAPSTTAAEHVIGDARARVTVTEYASVGCPHCAAWANTVFPEFKKVFLDTGRARFAFHEMLTGDVQLAAAGFLVAECAAPDHYFQVVDAIFADQVGIAQGGAPALFKVAEAAGLTTAQFQACLTNEAALKDLEERTESDAKAHGVDSTPTFIIGDQKFVGAITLDQLRTAIEKAQQTGRRG